VTCRHAHENHCVDCVGCHAAGGTREFISAIVRHPLSALRVDDLVVEFGSARYQDVADRYVTGEPVPYDELVRLSTLAECVPPACFGVH
jgi:hypothetical protein